MEKCGHTEYLKCEIVVQKDGNGYRGSCTEFPGLHVPGDSVYEALHNLADAITAYAESLGKHGEQEVPDEDSH